MAEYELTGVLQTEAQMNTELSLSASSGATDNYEMLKNRPSINGVVLSGDKSSAELNIVTADDVNKAVSNYAQPIGDYATNAQLAAEKMQREDADNAIYSKIADVELLTSTYTASSITLTDAAQNSGLYSLKVYGSSTQNGTPTPESPADIVSVGDSGSLAVTTNNGGDLSATATITSALPLCAVGDVCDELIFNADGTAKIVKRTKVFDVFTFKAYDASNNIFVTTIEGASTRSNIGLCNLYELYTVNVSTMPDKSCRKGGSAQLYVKDSSYSTAAEINAGLADKLIFIGELATPQEISLTAAEAQALLGLETYDIRTNITNSDNAQMTVKYWRNEDLGSLFTQISRNTNSRLAALETAIINA